MADPPKTICTQCRHHLSTHDGSHPGPRPDVWFWHFCTHPSLAREAEIDPVTGKTAQGDRHPHCRDINKGDCPYYEAKLTVAGRAAQWLKGE